MNNKESYRKTQPSTEQNRIDRKKKIFASTLLLALGFSKNDIVNEFYDKEVFTFDTKLKKWKTKFNPENYKAKNFSEEVIDAKSGKIIIKAGDKINYLNAYKNTFCNRIVLGQYG